MKLISTTKNEDDTLTPLDMVKEWQCKFYLLSTIDLPDYCIKANKRYKVKYNDGRPYINVWLGFLQPDNIFLSDLSQEQLNSMKLHES